jgi:ketosteroid isomerase-like protein
VALADRAAILDTVAEYAFAVDGKDWAAVAALFTDDAEGLFGGRVGTAHGGTAIAEAIRRTIGDLDATHHMVTNSVVRLHGDDAEHNCYLHAQHIRDGNSYVVGGRYDDRLRRVGDRWLLCGRLVTRNWTSGDRNVIVPS